MRKFFTITGILFLLVTCPVLTFGQVSSLPDHIKNQLVNEHGLKADQLTDLELKDHYISRHNQVEHYYLHQTDGGLEVFNAQLSVHVKDNTVIQVNNGLVVPETSNDLYLFSISAKQAIVQGAAEVGLTVTENEITAVWDLGEERKRETLFNVPGISDDPVKAGQLLFPDNNTLVPAWKVEIYTKDHSHYWVLLVDAATGVILNRSDQVITCNWGPESPEHQHAIPGDRPYRTEAKTTQATQGTGEYEVFPMPYESPNHGPRTVVSDPSDSIASPFGWHDINGVDGAEFTYTRGNNVLAWEDKEANNTGGQTVDGGSQLSFKADYDKQQSAANFTDAAIINLFYWNNIMHDVWYHYGFDEASGNFQQNNYGNGGAQGDYVIAEAQDGSGYNNANFAAFADGTNGRMQMYLWGNVTPGTSLTVTSPSGMAGNYTVAGAMFGGELNKVPVTGNVVFARDSSTNPTEACSQVVNTSEVSGQIALLDRGSCTFVQKVKNAQNAGAIAAIVINNQGGAPFSMSGTDASITIPAVMISRADGDIFRNELNNAGTITASLYDSSEETFFYDSDFDNGVIAHEYGHGISIRLAGGPSSSGCLSGQEQMGEGWSDFFALVMTHEPGDSGEMRRGIGTYVKGQGVNGRGIRPYPYSTDTTINPTTYADIATFSIPHGVGSVWCQMIWDMYWAFIDEYGYDADIYHGTGGNNMAMQLVIDGLKLQKCGPGFTDARDAILLADRINNGGRNQMLIWTVFAKRGLGYSADQGSPSLRNDGIEAFDVPENIFSISVTKTAAPIVKGGEERTYRFVVQNMGDTAASNVVIRDTLDARLIPKVRDGNCEWTISGNIATYVIEELPAFDTFTCELNVIVDNTGYSGMQFIDSVEGGDGIWTTGVADGTGGFFRTANISKSGDSAWFIDDPATPSDRFLTGTLNIGTDKPALAFYHYYNTEASWDGAVIEIDTGSGWIDQGDNFIINGYNSTIQVNPASAISGRDAFTGNSDSFIYTVLDLSDYKGKVADLRFRFVSDGAAGGVGWYIDDITLFDTFEFIRNNVTITADNYTPASSSALSVLLKGKDPVSAPVRAFDGKLFIYPNPASERLYVRNDLQSEVTLRLVDVKGVEISSLHLAHGEDSAFDVSSLSSGVYFVKAQTESTSRVYRVIVR